jgi:hypothetical protein
MFRRKIKGRGSCKQEHSPFKKLPVTPVVRHRGSGGKKVKACHNGIVKGTLRGHAWWCTALIPVTQEEKIG